MGEVFETTGTAMNPIKADEGEEMNIELEKSYEMSIKALEDERAKLVKPLDDAIGLLKDRLVQLRRPSVTGLISSEGSFTASKADEGKKQ